MTRQPHLEFVGSNILLDLEMTLGWSHVLTKGDDINIDLSEFFKRRLELMLLLAKAKHDARLGDDSLFALHILDVLQNSQALSKGSPSVSHIRSQVLDSFDIVRIDVKPALRHDGHHVQIAAEVTGQCLNKQGRLLLLDLPNSLGEMPRTTVRKIVSVHARQDDVTQSPSSQSLCSVLGFVRIQRARCTVGLDAAEAASSGARVAHQHDGGGRGTLIGATPAFGYVGTSSFLTHGVQTKSSEVLLDALEVVVSGRDRRLEPLWQSRNRLLPALRADLGGSKRKSLGG